MARKSPRGWWSDLDLPWWSLAAISVLTLLVATITGCAPRPPVAAPPPTQAVAGAPALPLPAIQPPFDAVDPPASI
jgi:hypothetical protein